MAAVFCIFIFNEIHCHMQSLSFTAYSIEYILCMFSVCGKLMQTSIPQSIFKSSFYFSFEMIAIRADFLINK